MIQEFDGDERNYEVHHNSPLFLSLLYNNYWNNQLVALSPSILVKYGVPGMHIGVISYHSRFFFSMLGRVRRQSSFQVGMIAHTSGSSDMTRRTPVRCFWGSRALVVADIDRGMFQWFGHEFEHPWQFHCCFSWIRITSMRQKVVMVWAFSPFSVCVLWEKLMHSSKVWVLWRERSDVDTRLRVVFTTGMKGTARSKEPYL
jgi:hypothetical protein